jgi:predicted CXXCH cytochrome family protein
MILMAKRNNHIIRVITVALLTLLVSCSSRGLLTFFFDGVPVKDTSITASSTGKGIDENNSEVFRAVPAEISTDYIVHYPYKEKECYSCHDEKSKSELIMPQPQLCYTCHDDLSKKYKYLHGPVAAGYCTSCHNPHMSKEKNLMMRSGQQICLNCHEQKSVLKNDSHKDIAETDCTLCHNPHGGETRFILN